MTQTKKILTNTLWHFLAKTLGLIIGVITIALITRYLGQTGFGQYATALAWLQFSGILVDFGLYMVLLSELGKAESSKQEKKIAGNLLTLRAISAVTILILSIGIAWLTPYDNIIKLAITVLSGAFFFQLINQILTGVFQHRLAMTTGSLIEVVGKALGLIFIFIAIDKNWGLIAIVAAMTSANLINTGLMWVLANRLTKLKFCFDLPYWRQITKLAWPLAVGTIFNLFYFKTDTLILSFFHSSAIVGIYAAPYRILEVLISLPPVFLGLTMPLIARQWQQKDIPGFTNSIQKSFDFFHLFTIPAVIGTLMLAKPIMELIAGKEFIVAAPVLQILIIATAFIFYAQLLSYAIVSVNQQKFTLKYIVIASLLALSLYFIFIPIYSYWAAAIITVLVEASIMLAFYLFLKKYLTLKLSWRMFRRTLLSALVMAVVILVLTPLPVILTIVLAMTVYLLSLLLFKAVNVREIKTMLNL